MATLYSISYSPWSERASWALDYCGFQYRKVEYTPLISELGVRLKTRTFASKMSVPAYVDGRKIVVDSLEIAQYAANSADAKLFPDSSWQSDYHQFDQLADSSRAVYCYRILNSPDALMESVPSYIPAAIRKGMLGTAKMTVKNLAKKYGAFDFPESRHLEQMREILRETTPRLQESPYLSGSLSFLDMTLASALEFVSPVADNWIRIGPATRDLMTVRELAEEFSDLIAWRDDLYEKHRIS